VSVRMPIKWLVVFAILPALVAAGCGGDDDDSSGSSATTTAATTTGARVAGSITISAAASLTEAFGEMGTDFTAAHPDAKVTFNFGSSGTLATQIQQGAPADTFASADEDNMNKLVSDGLVDGTPTLFATNRLVIVTKPGNPKHVKSLADLSNLSTVSLCGESVPCGKYAAEILQRAGVTIPEKKVTRGQDVKATLGAVTTGDADAAVVYATDARAAANRVETVAIPDAQNAIAAYPIATLKASGNKQTSRAFVDFVVSDDGQATLRSFGFLPPPGGGHTAARRGSCCSSRWSASRSS
jgi:molybdate transport system substrate-binding protein